MNRALAALAILAAVIVPSIARAEVVSGNAVPGFISFGARQATELASVGPLAQSLQGKPVVVRIHADWCSACKATKATIDQLTAGYAGKISFIQFDVTNAKTAAASEEQAQQLGLEKFFDATKAATSTVAVIDPKTGKVYATFYNDDQIGDYQKVLDAALKVYAK